MNPDSLVLTATIIAILLQIIYIIAFASLTFRHVAQPELTVSKPNTTYKVLNEYARQNENTLLLSGSIFVTGSVILLAETATVYDNGLKVALVLGSWMLYATWLFMFQLFGAQLAHRAYERLKEIEKLPNDSFWANRYLGQARNPIRRWVWFVLFQMLVVIGLLLLGSSEIMTLAFIEFVIISSAFLATCLWSKK